MSQFKRFNASENRNYDNGQMLPAGTLTWDQSNGLRLHDGDTYGGHIIGVTEYSELTNRPYGSSAVSDLMGGSNSDDNGKFLQQYATGQSAWANVSYNDLTDKPTIPSDVSNLTDSTGLLPAAQVRFVMKSASFTAEAGKTYWVNSSGGAYTMTLPADPTTGDWVKVYDGELTWVTNNLTVNGNGNNIRIFNMGGGGSPGYAASASTAVLNQAMYSPVGAFAAAFVWNGSVWSGAM